MKATLRNIRISPKKMNVVAELVRNMPAKKAEILLSFTPKKGAKILEKVIASAIANATNNFKQNVDELVLKEVKVLAGMLVPTPPPVRYLTVKIVFEGAIPYVPVYKKFTGEYAAVNLSLVNGNPIPTLLGLGLISSSVSYGEPAPN